MGLLLNSTQLGDKQYEIQDSRGYLKGGLAALKLPGNYYGGRITNVAKTEEEGIYLLVEIDRVIDIYIPDLTALEAKTLKLIADSKGVEYTKSATVKQMLTILGEGHE